MINSINTTLRWLGGANSSQGIMQCEENAFKISQARFSLMNQANKAIETGEYETPQWQQQMAIAEKELNKLSLQNDTNYKIYKQLEEQYKSKGKSANSNLSYLS